jgi:small-conductance mechanosensitive channel
MENTSIAAGVYFIGSFIFAKLADWIFSFIFGRLVGKTKTNVDDRLLDILHKPIYYSILFIGFSISIRLLALPEYITFVIIGVLKSIIILVWSTSLFRGFMHMIQWYSNKETQNQFVQARTLPLFDNLGKIIIFIGSVYFVFLSWDIDVTGWVASAGIISVVIGFAAKDTLANLFAGIFIMADAPYKEGDYINLDTGERGYVRSIGIRSTRIMTRDDIEITVPNSVIANSKIVNESGGPFENERIRINVSVAYGSDIDKVKSILQSIAVKSENVCNSPEPRVRFRELGDSGLIFQLLFWIEKPEMRGRVADEINTTIYNAFNEAKIDIPFPQRTIHLVNKES